MNQNMIVGCDWLTKNGVRLYLDLGSLRIGKTYVPLVEDIHISSVVRTTKKLILKLQTTNICQCRIRNSPDLPNTELY